MHHRACVVGLLAAGCTVGAPAGFSGGDSWTLPLVGPLEGGTLIVPATVRGHGPYLFAIDPDANVTAVDEGIVKEAELQNNPGARRVDETDTGQPRGFVDLIDLKVGNLTIDRRSAMVFPTSFYDTEGRVIRGVLGRDAIPESLVFGFDRDHGIATLATTKSFAAPPDAIAIKYESLVSDSNKATSTVLPGARVGAAGSSGTPLAPVQRRLASARIGDATLTMHLDLGAATSQLREGKWTSAKLVPTPARLRTTDEAGTARDFTKAGVASEVALGAARATGVTFVPYVEKRFVLESVDGALGLDFFQPYAVYASWDNRTYYLKPRGDAAATVTARLARWGTALPACAHPGCVTAELVTSNGNATLNVVRDPEAATRPLEVLLQVTVAAGKPPSAVVPLLIELPAATDRLTGALPKAYAGATVAVTDVSPFPRNCVDATGCILPLGVPAGGDEDDAPPPAAAPAPAPDDAAAATAAALAAVAPKSVPLAKLHRLAGSAEIPPSGDVKKTLGNQKLATAIVKLCLTVEGKVDFTKLVKSSGAIAYDTQLQDTIKATWSFEPVQIDGAAQPVCTTLTFKPS